MLILVLFHLLNAGMVVGAVIGILRERAGLLGIAAASSVLPLWYLAGSPGMAAVVLAPVGLVLAALVVGRKLAPSWVAGLLAAPAVVAGVWLVTFTLTNLVG